jgi:hypothetical protein
MFIETDPPPNPRSVRSGMAKMHNLFNRTENVFFIVLNFESTQKIEIFFPKGFSGMMLLLVRDVLDDVVQL